MEQNIEITRGDTASFNLQFVDFAGDLEHDVQDMFLTVKEDINGSAIFQKSLGNGISKVIDNVYVVRIAPEDTEDLNLGYYYYDFEVKINDDVFTLLKGVMQITYDVTDPTSIITIAPYAELQDIRVGYNGITYPSAGDAVRDQVSDLHEEFDVLDGRMDEFASLPEGSTAGNAELVDIRVGANGITYPSAGDAVRGQVEELDDKILDNATDIGEIDSDVDVLKARMDTFASLPDGSTAGDAELEDIRVGADGVTYASAGDAVRGQVSDLKEDLDDTRAKMMVQQPINLLDLSALEDGYMGTNGSVGGSGASYKHTAKIPVNAGDVITFWRDTASDPYHFSAIDMRFVCAFDSDENAVPASGSSSTVSSYTVPSGITYVVFSIQVAYLAYNVMIIKGTTKPNVYRPYFKPFYRATNQFLTPQLETKKGYMRATEPNALTSDGMEFVVTNIVKNVVYSFECNVATFDVLVIGQGRSNSTYSSYARITTTNVYFTINGNDYTFAHGLTIDKYIKIIISVNDNTKATLTLISNGEIYTKTIGWYGFSRAGYFVRPEGTSVCTNNVFCVSFQDMVGADTYVFGDSYAAILESTSKWTHWLVDAGYGNNALINACPGINGTDSIVSLNNILIMGIPKYLCWFIGMNDGADTNASTPNATWLSLVQYVIKTCEQFNIIPILGTVPTVPSVLNEGKNAWIRSSGYRYVDFAKAVGASDSGVWFDGMLSSDLTHPTELGAKALWNRVLSDFPEITM